MRSSGPGRHTSQFEVTNISVHGLWLLVQGRESFLPYVDYPRFSDQPLKSVLKVEEPSPSHFHWPDIDVKSPAMLAPAVGSSLGVCAHLGPWRQCPSVQAGRP